MSVGPHPLATVWQALDAGGYAPHGAEHDFRARCPGHQGDNPGALHVSEGADRRALLHCFRGCEPDRIVRALGLQWRDLFPAGHHRHHRRPRPRPMPRGPVEVLLDGLHIAGIGVRGLWVADACPYCDAPAMWIRSTRAGGVDCECANGCLRAEIVGALETIVAIREARRDGRRTRG